MRTDYKDTRYTKLIRVTPEDYKWIGENRGKKSRAGFLEYIINRAVDKNAKSPINPSK